MVIKKNQRKFKRYFTFIVLVTAGLCPVFSQNYSGWYNAAIKLNLPHKFSSEIQFESRTSFQNPVNLNQYFPQIELGYKINKRFDVSAAYRFSRTKEDNGYFYNRNKFYFNFFTDYPIKRFTLKNRFRYQLQTKQYIDNKFDKIPDKKFRDKIEVSYNIKKTPLEPSLSFEMFYPLNYYKINNIDEYRIEGSLSFPLAKKHDMEIGILYIKERFPIPEKSYILTLAYSFSAKL